MNSCFSAGRESGDKNKAKKSAQSESRKIKKENEQRRRHQLLLASSLAAERGESGWKMGNGK